MRTTVFSATPGLLTIQLPQRKLGRLHWLSSRHINQAVSRALRWVPDLKNRSASRFSAQRSGSISDLYLRTGDGYLQFDYAAARSLDARKSLCYIEKLAQSLRKHT
jgi:hypothetical protein